MADVLADWLRAVQTLPGPQRERLLLRGSLLTNALLAAHSRPPARPPADVDYLVTGDFDRGWMVATVHAALAEVPTLHPISDEVIWGHTRFPGVRVWVDVVGTPAKFTADFAFHDPVSLPPLPVRVLDVPDVRSCAAEDLWAWKVHGLVEFGQGRWRAKDLYDLARLSELPLDPTDLRRAVLLAFESRGDALDLLGDLLTREGWGQSFSNGRKWRSFCRKAGVEADLLTCRDRVKAQLERLDLPLTP